MGVYVRRGLVIGVPNYLHGDQRVDARLVQQCDVIVPEEMRSQQRLNLLAVYIYLRLNAYSCNRFAPPSTTHPSPGSGDGKSVIFGLIRGR